jgi:hypothetical protein
MGKPLSMFQRWAREGARASERRANAAGRERERVRAALIRAAEREDAARLREAEQGETARLRGLERAQIAGERAAERARVRGERDHAHRIAKQEKEDERRRAQEAKDAQVAEWRAQVAVYDEYVAGLASLHARPMDLAAAAQRFSERQQPRVYLPIRFIPRPEPDAPHLPPFVQRQFQGTPFALSNTKTFEVAATWIFLGVASVVSMIALLPFAGAIIGFGVSGSFGLASVVGFFVRRERVLKPRHAAEEQRRFHQHVEQEQARERQYADWMSAQYAQHGQAVAHFRAQEAERRARFDSLEASNAAAFVSNEEARRSTLAAAARGEAEALAAICWGALPLDMDLEAPEGMEEGAALDDHDVGFVASAGRIWLYLRAPDLSLAPVRHIEMSADGTKLKTSKVTEKDRVALYKAFICSFSVAYVGCVFVACPNVSSVEVHSFVPGVDPASGAAINNVLLTATFPREIVSKTNLARVEPESLVETLGGTARELTKKTKALLLATNVDDITWVTGGDRPASVPFGLVDGQEGWESSNEFAN